MTPTQIERNREFLKDLRENPHKAFGQLRDAEGGRCCLGVALDTAVRLGFPAPKDHLSTCNTVVLPPVEMAEFYGWIQRNPVLGRHSLTVYNDGGADSRAPQPALTHKEIADLIELNLDTIAT